MAAGGSSLLKLHATPVGCAKTGGCRERVVALYETYREAIYRFLMSQGLNPAAAQDVTQDVFVHLFVAFEKGISVNSESAWLYTVAGRAVVDYWRREHRPIWAELDSAPGAAANVPSLDLTPETRAANREQIVRVAARLRRLPKEQRLCIHLRMQGLRYREIARILGVSTSTAAEWLASAVDRLRGDAND